MELPEKWKQCLATGDTHTWLELTDPHPNPQVKSSLLCAKCCLLIHKLHNGLLYACPSPTLAA